MPEPADIAAAAEAGWRAGAEAARKGRLRPDRLRELGHGAAWAGRAGGGEPDGGKQAGLEPQGEGGSEWEDSEDDEEGGEDGEEFYRDSEDEESSD
jgi:hypothetical protein